MNEATYVYIVHSDINENNIYAEFATKEEALDYARRNSDELTYVDKVEVALDEDGEIIEMFDSETIWVYDDEFDGYTSDIEENVFDTDFDDGYPLDEGIHLKNDAERKEFFQLCDEIGIYTDKDINNFMKEVGCTGENLLQALRDYRAELGPDFKIADPELEKEMAKKYEGIDFDALVEELEENEDMVECKECFDLVAKESCTKGEHGYVCEKCSKTLTESISELTPEQLAAIENYLKTVGDLYLEEYEQEYDFAIDIVGGDLTYNTKTNTFDFYLSIYHASEDNNAEYPERHTDEDEYSFDTIEEVYDEFPEYLEDIYKWNASEISKVEEAIQMTRDELMNKEGTDDVELINAGRPEEERVELVEEDNYPGSKPEDWVGNIAYGYFNYCKYRGRYTTIEDFIDWCSKKENPHVDLLMGVEFISKETPEVQKAIFKLIKEKVNKICTKEVNDLEARYDYVQKSLTKALSGLVTYFKTKNSEE